MTKIKNITGVSRVIFNLRVRLTVFLYFVKELSCGRLPLRKFVPVLRRLSFFLSRLQDNKFVEINGKVKLGLYIPGVPSRAFDTACDKFTVFNEKMPCTTVLVSLTSACRFRCEHCYQKLDKGKDIGLDQLVKAIRSIQNHGIALFNLEGGDPFIVFDRLKNVCEAIDDRSEIWINATGDGMSIERLEILKNCGMTACMFPLLSPDEDKVNQLMGSPGAWATIRDGIEKCHQLDIPVAINTCLQKEDFYDGTFEACMDFARDHGAALVQIIKPKPAGGWLQSGASTFTPDDLELVKSKVLLYNRNGKYKDYPAISAQILEEAPEMFGCTAGGTDRFYLNAKGDVQGCEFLNLSFGNIADEDVDVILERMRQVFRTPGDCWLCEEYAKVIHDKFIEQNLTSLPLSPDLSKEIWETFATGEKTALYDTIENKLV